MFFSRHRIQAFFGASLGCGEDSPAVARFLDLAGVEANADFAVFTFFVGFFFPSVVPSLLRFLFMAVFGASVEVDMSRFWPWNSSSMVA